MELQDYISGQTFQAEKTLSEKYLLQCKKWLTEDELFFLVGKMSKSTLQNIREKGLITYQLSRLNRKSYLYLASDVLALLDDESNIVKSQPINPMYQTTPDISKWDIKKVK